jgi:nucleotide-binding universal stress UspA family protein
MFGNVLAAVDFSPATDALIGCLPRVCELGGERLTLVHVARLESPVEGWVTHLDYYRRRLEEPRGMLEDAGWAVEVDARAGEPVEQIVAAARERGATLIVVGSRGTSSTAGGFLGSVAWGVVQRAEVPVLVARIEPGADAGRAAKALGCFGPGIRVAFATDFGEASERAWSAVRDLVGCGLRHFTLLHVRARPTPPSAPGGVDRDALHLDVLAKELRDLGASEVDVEVLTGDPLKSLLEAAGRRPDTILVLGTRGRGFLAELASGSVSHALLRRATSSVLLVRG